MLKKRLVHFFALLLGVAIAHGQTNLTTLALSAGQKYALSLRSDGSVWAWGTNQVGEVGLGTNALVLWPTRISSITNIVSISAGSLHSLAAQNNGTVWAWGLNSDGRLGNGNFNTASNPVTVTRITNAVAVSAGGNHSLALLANGSVMAWGANIGGQLGTGNTVSTNQPVQAGSFTNVIAVSAGTNFSLALTQDGSVWAWGTNNMGQLGLGSTTTQLSPVKITTLSNIVQVAAGASHSLAMDRNGVVYAWGRNTEGQIGNGSTINATAPVVVPSFGSTTNLGAVKWVEAGYNSSAAILKSGRLFYWGWYGNGTFWSSNQPPQELNANSGLVFNSVTYGDSYLLAGNQDGSTWAWGFNQYAQRGNGNYYATSDTWSYQLGNADFSFSASPYPVTTRFTRGDRNDLNYLPMLPYNSFVLPLDLEKGVRLNNTGNDAYGYGASQPWFLNVQKITRQHAWQITTSTNLSRFPVDNPIVAFGQSAGGSPLYINQPYRFGLFGGAYNENTGQTNMIRILVYDRNALASGATNVAPTNTFYIALPRRDIAADATAWSNYVTNGNRVVFTTNNLTTSVEFNNGQNNFQSDIMSTWGLGWIYAIPSKVTIDGYRLTHMATSTNYCYIVEALGQCEVGANVFAPMAVTNSTGWAYLPIYALGFDAFPAWRAHFLDNPNFAGTPIPPTYTGRTSLELGGLTATITNNIWITNNAAYTNLDNSPELRRSPILDQFVSDMHGDPLALANYVVNNIGFTDPIAYGETANAVANSIELGGVNRSALGTYLEGQGSPVEQCALLVYLLRQAGYPATYVWPTNSNLQLMDTTVSRLWQINVHGIVWNSGIPIITNSLIVVDYPWVVANIGTNSVQIFPWLKNTAINKGLNIYDYLPTNYPNAYAWVKDYALANPSLMALASPNDGVAKYWQNYLTSVINTNKLQPNLSLQDFGVWSVNRPQNYTSWSQLPMPDALYNQSKVAVIQTLSDSPVTYPFLTNIFDEVRIEVFQSNTNTANKLIDSGLWRTCDLHNRKLLLYTNVPNSVSLWLSAYRTGITNTSNFTNYLSSTNALLVQVAKGTITSAVTNLPVRITYQKRIGLLANPNIWYPSQGYYGGTFAPFNCSPRDVSAIIPSVASVSSPMLNVWAQDYWNLEQKRAINTNYVPAVTDEAGDAAMIMASTFFQKLWSDNQLNQNLHQVRGLSWDSWGVASLTQLSNYKMQVKLNMNWFATFVIGNAMANQDSGDTGLPSLNNFMTMMQANGSSAEYSTIASVWPDQSPVSSIRLIQIAAQNWRTNGTAIPPELNVDNYTALGNLTYTGYGSTALKNQIPAIWNQVTNVFTTEMDSNYVRILITPGQVTNSTGSFKGMASLIFGETQMGAMISDNQTALNGGYGDVIDWVGMDDFSSAYDFTYTLDYSPSYGSYTFVETSITVPTPLYDFSAYDVLNLTASSGSPPQVAFTPQQVTQGSIIAAGLNLPTSSTANAIKSESDVGWLGNAWARIKQGGTVVFDPVQVVSGDFCADSVDIALAGPMPLPLHRNYQSRNLAIDQVGAGWKFGIMPWLVITTNSTGNVIANAAEMDGSVLAYRQQTNGVWTVMTADNPDLVNFTPNGIGGTANVFNNYIQQNPTNNQIYTLTASDGSKRVFQVMTNFGIADGTNYLNRIRPYLTLWQDHAGNYYQFIYGTNTANNNFGQLYRIQSANGASLTFQYDYYGRVTQVLSDDNRTVNYQYDNYGDLVGVTLPDNTTWQYGYQHYAFTTNSQSYTDSYHLLTTETKPDGRQLANTYDNLRRVIAQAATVGINRELITNATFFYTNNCTGLTNTLISGVTCVQDVFGNPYYYYYTNNLVTQVIEPLGRTNIQSWYSVSQTNVVGYYQNSLQYAVDVRGLTNWFLYDSNGNLTNQTIYGNLTGNGVGGDSATNSFTFTTNNVVATATDPSGNTETFNYDSADGFQLDSLQFSSGGIGVFTNRWTYTNVTTVVNMGGWYQTNSSFGLCASAIKADAATNALTYNGRGFPTQLTRYAVTADVPGNADPAIVTYLTFSPRGDLISAVDASGRQVAMNYDALGRLEWRDVSDQNSNTLSHETFYYDSNGELQWYDGPRSNPDDYIYFSYDGAGRTLQKIHWRTQAKPDGTGIQAIPGDSLYATTFNSYDYFGNLTSVADSRGAYTTNSWDALGRLVQRRAFDVGGSTQLSSDGFAYEVGGLVQSYTNALGGVTTTLYTSAGQPSFRQNADGSTNGWTYYLDGRINREIQGNGAYWQTTYNDASLTVTRIFYSAASSPLATNTIMFDRRGNEAQYTDAGGNTFANSFDGLNRVKVSAGPAIVTVSSYQLGNPPSGTIYFATNVLQQVVTNFYDAAGIVVTNINALGEKTVTTLDALGRTTSTLIYNASGSLARERYFVFSADNNSATVTDGSGANAISHTIYTDSDGHPVLSVAYPSAYSTEFTLNQFDVAGNLVSAQHNSTLNGAVTTWATANYSFDGLNRMTGKVDRDNASTTYAYDLMGDLTNCTIPGSSQWQATYNNAGQMLQGQNFGGGNPTRTTTYSYFSSGNSFAGLLQTKTDGRGTSCTYSYDDWLRPTNMACSGSLPEQNLTTTWQYEPRGFVTGTTEQFASTNTGPTTTISHSFDPYGQLSSESVSAGSFGYGSSQSWDAAGRRSQLGVGGGNYGFGWQADGSLVAASDPTGSGAYSYYTAGLLTNRLVGNRMTGITSLDGEGRPLSIVTTVNTLSQLTESLTWSGDGLLAAHTLARADFTDSRVYSYANLSRRLVQEQLNLNGSTTWTNTMVYDNGVSGGPGVLTQMGQANSASNKWSGVADAFSRVATESNSTSLFPAYGHVNGQSVSLNAWLDNQPVSISSVGTNAMQWRAMMELAPGTHQLKVSALHPSGIFTAWATNSFTNGLAYQTTADSYDSAGNITNRVWKNPSGTVERTQTLSWDARGRLHAVTDRDTNNSGYNWSTVYDPLNRRLQTTTVLVSNGVASTAPPQTINSYFDPQVEFLELGISYGNQTIWKLYGPDQNGTYGGLNGAGGLDSVSPYLNSFNPLISDFRGNILAEITNGMPSWIPARPTGYGAVPGYRPAAFANGADIAQSSAWHGREVDITGYIQVGLRPYDPVSGRWLTYDSAWNAGDPDGYTFCAGGDPINYFDPDGRIGKQYAQFQYNGGVAGYGLRSLAGAFNHIGSSSGSTYISWGSFNDASLLNMAASAVTPSSYVNGYQNLQNRAENVMVGEYLNGSGNTWAAAQGLSSVVGDSIGYNNIYEASFNVDRQSLTSLSGADRWSRGLMGGSQLILTGVGLKAAYNPEASFLGQSAGAQFVFDARTGRYRDVANGQFVAARNLPWPGNNGFISSQPGVLPPGTIIDRFGSLSGRYAGSPGATISQRGLAAGSENMLYNQFQVLKPLPAQIGPAAPVPAFGAVGGSAQYLFDYSINDLIIQGYLK
ncbi:MAG: glycohydrolase toxin TNT-related protein [Verrucomicrobiota bacterium]|jgi:RHS repeat-associated protein